MKYDPEFIRNVSELVYRLELGPGGAERMVAKDGDDGSKLRKRAKLYDRLTRTYLRVLREIMPEVELMPVDMMDAARRLANEGLQEARSASPMRSEAERA
jgi:hypothetical protein